MPEDIRTALAKIALDLATQSWISAAKSGLDLVSQAQRGPRRVAEAAAKSAADSLAAWASREGITEADLDAGLATAGRAAAVRPESFAEIAALHYDDVPAMSDALLAAAGARDGSEAIARAALDAVLSALMGEPSFRERLDRAVDYGVYRELLEQRQRAERDAHRAVQSAQLEALRLRTRLRRHSDSRAETLLEQHRDRPAIDRFLVTLPPVVRAADAWRSRIRARLDTLAAAAAEAGRGDLATRLRADDLAGPFPAVVARLRRMLPLVDDAEAAPDPPVAPAVRHAATALRHEVKSPRYGTALLLAGRWGSGKSRAVGELAEGLASARTDVVILRVLPERNLSFEASLLKEAARALGRPIADIVEVGSALADHDLLGVVVADDLDRFVTDESDVEAFVQLLLDSTAADRLRWALTMDTWRLDRLLHGRTGDRWTELAVIDSGSPLSGWVDLDAVCTAEEVGIDIVRRETGAAPAATDAVEELLHFPRHAWLYVGTTVRGTAFEEAYWDAALADLTSTPAELAACRALRAQLEVAFSRTGGRPVPRPQLIAEVTDRLAPRDDDRPALTLEEAYFAVDVLGEAGVISLPLDEDVVGLRSPALWAVGIARNVAHRWGPKIAVPDATREVEKFLGDSTPELGEAFLTQLIAQLPWGGYTEDRAHSLLARLIRSPAVDSAGVWAAALVLGDDIRSHVVQALLDERSGQPASTTRHAAYLLLRLAVADDSNWPFVERIRAIQLDYPLVGSGLERLLHEVIATRFHDDDVATAPQRAELLQLAEGIERARSGAEFAHAWVDRASRSVDPRRLLAEVSARFEEARPFVDAGTPLRVVEGVRSAEAPFAVHLADAAAALVAKQLGVADAYREFQRAGWLRHGQGVSRFAFALRSTCHVALGRRFADDPEELIDLVSTLVGGGSDEQETALFIIRHTVTTGGQPKVRPPVELEPLVQALAERGGLPPRVHKTWLQPMLEAIAEASG